MSTRRRRFLVNPGSGKGIGGSGGDVDASGTEGNGGKDYVAGLGETVKEKGAGKRKS